MRRGAKVTPLRETWPLSLLLRQVETASLSRFSTVGGYLRAVRSRLLLFEVVCAGPWRADSGSRVVARGVSSRGKRTCRNFCS